VVVVIAEPVCHGLHQSLLRGGLIELATFDDARFGGACVEGQAGGAGAPCDVPGRQEQVIVLVRRWCHEW
jgi:hypothetical protein